MESVTIDDLIYRVRRKKPADAPNVDTLKSALGRVAASLDGKLRGKREVVVGRHRDGTKRFGFQQFYATVIAADVIAIGAHLESKSAHTDRTRIMSLAAMGAKTNLGGKPRYIHALVDELEHMLKVATTTGV